MAPCCLTQLSLLLLLTKTTTNKTLLVFFQYHQNLHILFFFLAKPHLCTTEFFLCTPKSCKINVRQQQLKVRWTTHPYGIVLIHKGEFLDQRMTQSHTDLKSHMEKARSSFYTQNLYFFRVKPLEDVYFNEVWISVPKRTGQGHPLNLPEAARWGEALVLTGRCSAQPGSQHHPCTSHHYQHTLKERGRQVHNNKMSKWTK